MIFVAENITTLDAEDSVEVFEEGTLGSRFRPNYASAPLDLIDDIELIERLKVS